MRSPADAMLCPNGAAPGHFAGHVGGVCSLGWQCAPPLGAAPPGQVLQCVF